MPQWVQEVVSVLQGLTTIGIAVIAVLIARWQLVTARDRVRLDLFERRMKVFLGVQRFIDCIVADGEANTSLVRDLHLQTNTAVFLFGEDVGVYIKELRDRALRFHLIGQRKLDAKLGKEERAELFDEDQAILLWFSEQYEGAEKVFSLYLQFAAYSSRPGVLRSPTDWRP